MALIELNRKPADRDLRWFAWLFVPVFLAAMAGLAYWKFGAPPWISAVIFAPAPIAALVAWRRPQALRGVFVGWMLLLFPLGWTISHAVLAIVYFLVMTPLGLLMRIFGYDPLRRRIEPSAATYWVERPEAPEGGRYFRQF